MNFGYCEGDICGRPIQGRVCRGVIQVRPVENCSCHISPPCSACVDQEHFCAECEYESKYDTVFNDFVVNEPNPSGAWKCWERRPLDHTKIDWHSESHTHFTMIMKGVYPEGTTRAQVEEMVRGTFGGRFDQFGGGTFKYVAYTD